MRLANGRLGDDHMVGDYTYTNRQGSTVIDYLILSERDFHIVHDFAVGISTNFLTTHP